MSDSQMKTCGPSSCISDHYRSHQAILRRLDSLESRVASRVAACRRRATNLLDETPTSRRTHLRIFVSHRVHDENTHGEETVTEKQFFVPNVPCEGENSSKNGDNSTTTVLPTSTARGGKDLNALLSAAAHHQTLFQKKKSRKWTLIIEGAILENRPEHETPKKSCNQWDQGLAISGEGEKFSGRKESYEGDNLSLITSATAKVDVLQRDQWRGGIAERENDIMTNPLLFTHFFDKLEVEFKTVERVPNSTINHSALTNSNNIDDVSLTVDLSSQNAVQNTKTVTWNRITSNTTDARAFFINFAEEKIIHSSDMVANANTTDSTEIGRKSGYISAKIKLYRRVGDEEEYIPSQLLCDAVFPSFSVTRTLEGEINTSKKRKRPNDSPFIASKTNIYSEELPSLTTFSSDAYDVQDKDIFIPKAMSRDEALSAVFSYIRTHGLQDDADLSIINNDETLAALFGCNRMLLSALSNLLVEKGLLVRVKPGMHPIILNYKMTLDGAERLEEIMANKEDIIDNHSKTSPAGPNESLEIDKIQNVCKEADHMLSQYGTSLTHTTPTIFFFDVDVHVPNLHHVKTRDILRRIKHREFDYTSCRLKAKNSLIATGVDEETAKFVVEEAVMGKGLSPHHKQVWMSLAKGSHDKGEAQRASIISLRLTSLMEKLEKSCSTAQWYWDIVDACRKL